MSVVFEKTKLLTDKQFHYCPGCNHGIIRSSTTAPAATTASSTAWSPRASTS